MIVVTAGGGGVFASGWLMDRLTTAGYTDAPFRTGMIGTAGVVIPAALIPFASSLLAGLVLIAFTLFFASFPMPPSTAVMQIVPPPRMRSRVSAIFLCANSLVGLALGSALVGFLNDHLFGRASAVGASIAIVIGTSALLGFLTLALGRAPLRRYASRT